MGVTSNKITSRLIATNIPGVLILKLELYPATTYLVLTDCPHHHKSHKMAQRAGIALSCLAYDAEFSITRVDGAPEPPTFSSPVHHKLVDGHTIKDIVDTFKRSVGFDTKPRDNGFVVSLPIAASHEQHSAFGRATGHLTPNHFDCWANKCGISASIEGKVNMLFIDLTPGQIAAQVSNGCFENQIFSYRMIFQGMSSTRYIILGDVPTLSAQSVIDRLITPLLNAPLRRLNQIGIFRPDGAYPDLSLGDIKAKFPDTLIDWVTLDDVSYGAAAIMHRKNALDSIDAYEGKSTYSPTGIILVDGRLVTILPGFIVLPVERKVWFTTSQDDQTTITIRLIEGVMPLGEVKLEGLSPRPKGQSRIKVTLSIDSHGWTSVTAEELGSNLTRSKALGIMIRDSTVIEGYEQTGMMIGRDGVIGELPE
jgi:hypothetical protein